MTNWFISDQVLKSKDAFRRTNLREERNGSNHIGLSYTSELLSTYRQSRHCYKKLCSQLASSIPLSHRLYNKSKKWFKRAIPASLRHILLNPSNKDQLYQTVSFSPASRLSASVNVRLYLEWAVYFYSSLHRGRQVMDLAPGADLLGVEVECGKRVSWRSWGDFFLTASTQWGCMHASHAALHCFRSASAPPSTGRNSNHFLVAALLLSKPALGIGTKYVTVSE